MPQLHDAPTLDFAAMPVGKQLQTGQRLQQCPVCGRSGKHHLTGIAAESWTHEQRGVVPTKVCTRGK